MKTLPMPPMDLRKLVGPQDDEDFDNPTGRPIFPHLPASAYRFVFDFGCGCGRLARQLIQQSPRPQRYVGIDPHPQLIAWAAQHLAPAAPGFEFLHHDVYSPGYAPSNTLRLADHFPVEDGQASLVIAWSVFTHLTRDQAAFYLSEIRRILAPDGVAFTSWFFFDNESTPFFAEGPYALYADDKDFSAAVIFDRTWFLEAVQQTGLMVASTALPQIPGHQWVVWLAPRAANAVDQFPLGEEGSDYLCGATRRPRAKSPAQHELIRARSGSREGEVVTRPKVLPAVPSLFGPLAELAGTRREVAYWRSKALAWRAARTIAHWLGVKPSRKVS